MFTSLSFKFQSFSAVSSTKQSGIRGRPTEGERDRDVVFMNLMGFKGSREEPLPPLKIIYMYTNYQYTSYFIRH